MGPRKSKAPPSKPKEKTTKGRATSQRSRAADSTPPQQAANGKLKTPPTKNSTSSQPSAAPPPGSGDGEATATQTQAEDAQSETSGLKVEYDDTIASEEAANDLLAGKVDSNYTKLNLKNDTVKLVKGHRFHELSRAIFDSILQAPAEAPDGFTQEEKTDYDKHQRDALALCHKTIKTPEDIKRASARCDQVVYAAILLHTKGILVALLKEPRGKRNMGYRKTNTAYILDRESDCVSRLRKIAVIVRDSKRIAHDVLTGFEIGDLVRAPVEFDKRKKTNSISNLKKRQDQEAGKKLRDIGKEEAKTEAIADDDGGGNDEEDNDEYLRILRMDEMEDNEEASMELSDGVDQVQVQATANEGIEAESSDDEALLDRYKEMDDVPTPVTDRGGPALSTSRGDDVGMQEETGRKRKRSQ